VNGLEWIQKKQDEVFMELNISIDFYIPCTLVILTYVKTGHPLSPFHNPPQVTPKAASQCSMPWRFHITQNDIPYQRI
jgi:hypothetical protein